MRKRTRSKLTLETLTLRNLSATVGGREIGGYHTGNTERPIERDGTNDGGMAGTGTSDRTVWRN